MPAERYGSSYGFAVEPRTSIVSERYRYPLTEPPLFVGDHIVSITGVEVSNEQSILQVLDQNKKTPISAVVKRKNRDGSVRTLNVKIHRSEFEHTKRMMQPGFRSPLELRETVVLPSLDPDSFGWLYTDAEFIAWVDDPQRLNADQIPVFKATPHRVNGNRLMSAKEVRFLEKLGLFVIRDFRPTDENRPVDFYTDVVVSRFPKGNWKKGEKIYVQKAQFLMEPTLEVSIDGKTVTVKVLTLFRDHIPNDLPKPIP